MEDAATERPEVLQSAVGVGALNPGNTPAVVTGMMEGVTVFLTGCGRGVGAALAEALRDRGASVFAGVHPRETGLSHPPPPAERLVPVPIDVADAASVLAAAKLVGSRTRSLDLLLNVAGVLGDITTGVPGILDGQDMHRTYDVNAVGPLRVIRAALHVASAIVHNTLRPLDGRVIVMHPGWVRTWMRGTLDAGADLSPREAADGILSQVERALADPALFAGERPAFINGKGEPLPW